MRKIVVAIEGVEHVFNNDARGNKQAENLLLETRRAWHSHPYFTGLEAMLAMRSKQNYWQNTVTGIHGKAYQYRKKADKLESARDAFLKANPDIKHPGALSVNIKHID